MNTQSRIRPTFALAALALVAAAQASAEQRRCNASLGWETTGGSLKGSIIGFTGVGECGSSSVANRCRVRAREAIERCVRTQYERRWQHHPINSDGSQSPGYDRNPPEACLRGANIEGYSLKLDCWTRRTDGANPVRVCHNEDGRQRVPSFIDPDGVVTVSAAGDIKSALETSVCCFKDHGLQKFPNEEKVHVRLIARASSGNDPQKQCNMRLELEDDYEIDCKRVRETVCRK
jgi:hypothetical protein